MPTVKEQGIDPRGYSRGQPNGQVGANIDAGENQTGSVIELADLTTGPESDVNRLKSGIAALAADMRQIRGEQASLASNYETLSSELRDIKLVLAKVHANELRVSERSNSWFQPLPWVHAIFRKNNKPDKI